MPGDHRDPDSRLSVDVDVAPAGAWVTVAGEVDVDTADRLRESLFNALGRRPTRLTVDLGGVTFLDSIGIAALVKGYRLALEFAIPMIIENYRPSVERVLEISGVLPLLSPEP